jgi:hypothetical protein
VGPKGYQRSDERIYEDVCERLTRHGQVDARNIQVEVKQGEVTLKGTVISRQSKCMTEDSADSVTGVQDVHNELKIQQSQRQPERVENESGMPGGGSGRVDRVGQSGVCPAFWPVAANRCASAGRTWFGRV